MYTSKTIYYFEKPGPENTQDCAEIALNRAKELGIKDIVVASGSGRTAKLFAKTIHGCGIHLTVVTHAVGFSEPGVWEFDQQIAKDLETEGVTILKGTHALSGLERAITRRGNLGGSSRTEAIAEAFRRTIAVGMKVAVECTLIAADQGAFPIDKEIIAVGGTEEGADTVVVIRPAHTAQFFDLQIREFVAMPRDR